MTLYVPSHTSFFISGSFSDLGDMQIIQSHLASIGYEVHIKLNDSGPSSSELISNCDVFVTLVGLNEGAIRTPDGDTLPQMELNTAIREKRPVVAFLKQPSEESKSPRQQFFRQLVNVRLGEAVIRYDSEGELPNLCLELVRFGRGNRGSGEL